MQERVQQSFFVLTLSRVCFKIAVGYFIDRFLNSSGLPSA